MPNKQKIELVNKLKYLAAFQKECLDLGNWDEFDKLEAEIVKITEILTQED